MGDSEGAERMGQLSDPDVKCKQHDSKYPFDEKNYQKDREAILKAYSGYHLKNIPAKKFGRVVEVMEDVIIYKEGVEPDFSGQLFAQIDALLNDGWCSD